MLSKFKVPSNPSSRSSSVASMDSLNLDDLLNPVNPETDDVPVPEIETNMPTDSNEMPEFYKNFTLSHPLGNLLVRITSMNEELCKKNNIKDHDLPELSQLCMDFTKAIKMERNKVATKVNRATLNLEDNILMKELNYHSINTPVKPPTSFSQVDVITTPTKMAEVLKTFPTKSSQRFSGTSNGVNILEFLNSMNTAQAIMNLSKSEFLQILLKCTSGKVYSLVLECISYDHDIPDLYHSLLTLYDNRISSSTARRILTNYKATKNFTLTKVQSYILEMASRVASQIPVGKSRTSMFNIEATNALVRALPYYSSTLVTNVLNTLAAKLERNPSYVELTKALTKYTDSINLDINRNGVPSVGKYMMHSDIHNNKPKQRVYALTRSGRNQNNTNNRFNPPSRNYRQQNKYKDHPRNRSNKINAMRQNKYSDSPKNERVFNMNQDKNNSNKQERYFKGLYCSLCGGNNHTADQICYRMKDASGRVVETVPTYYPCELCLQKLGKKLFHPQSTCFSKNKVDETPNKV